MLNHDLVSLRSLDRRAQAILNVRPAYKEMVVFYMTIFRRQIESRDRIVVRPDAVTEDQARACLRAGEPLGARYDSGLDAGSLVALWHDIKSLFACGTSLLRQAVQTIEGAERAGAFEPAAWLFEQRPDREELITDAAATLGIEVAVLSTLARAVTYPHWEQVAARWNLAPRDGAPTLSPLLEWGRAICPVCGGPAELAELRSPPSTGDSLTAAQQRFLHCPFCGSRWEVGTLTCLACGSTKAGDAKYLFTGDEPELRIDFCRSCRHYLKTVNGDQVPGGIHVGLELLTTAHLDVLAHEKKLAPLEVRWSSSGFDTRS